MAKVVNLVKKVVVFAKSAQGKRDFALISAAVSAVAGLLKQFGVI